MLKKIVLAENPLAPESWETFQAGDVCKFLVGRFTEFPATARIYHGDVSQENDVTPKTEDGIAALQSLEGTFHVIVYAGDPVTLVYIGVVAVVAILAIALAPDVPEPMTRKQDNSSPNNELSERKNRARMNGRIPDIFGTVRSTPDLISPAYTIWSGNRPIEHSLMCVGVGAYDIPADEVNDGESALTDSTGASVEIYPPNTNPNLENEPQLIVGAPITEAFLSVRKNGGVSGQHPLAPNEMLISPDEASFIYTDNGGADEFGIKVYDNDFDLRNAFEAGETLEISTSSHTRYDYSTSIFMTSSPPRQVGFDGVEYFFQVNSGTNYSGIRSINSIGDDTIFFGKYDVYRGTYSGGVNKIYVRDPWLITPVWLELGVGELRNVSVAGGPSNFLEYPTNTSASSLDGIYEIDSVGENFILLVNPATVNPAWSDVQTSYDRPFAGAEIEAIGGGLLGPFVLDDPDLSVIMLTALSQQGLYIDDGTTQLALSVDLEMHSTPIDGDGLPTGVEETFPLKTTGLGTSKSSYRTTFSVTPAIRGRQSVTVRRVTDRDFSSTGQVNDEVQIEQLLSGADISALEFGNVTTVRAKTTGSAQLAVAGQGKLSMLATRKVPLRISGDEFTSELFPTNRADEIISFISLDPRIGNRKKSELDFENIYSTVAALEEYFGSSIATEFNYTFDSDNISYEEIMYSISRAIFCVAYRRGNQIKLNFERETQNSTLLFNHRNKLPGSETRTVRFGNREDNDGVEFEYADPLDDTVQTFYLPDSGSINPQRIDMPGIRNKLQAHFHANRAWNKVQLQHVLTTFDATQEADLLVLGDRILNADNTRPNIQDGEVTGFYGLEFELSQKVEFLDGSEYVIFLQSPDGSVESISATAGSTDYHVVLANAPTFTPSVDLDNYARTTYILVETSMTEANAFIVTEKQPNTNFTSTVTAINYNSKYYGNDKDYENGIVDENGNII